MKYQSLTEEEVMSAGLLAEGIYDFEIMSASEAQSNSGNDMFVLKLNVFDSEGKARGMKAWALPQMPKQWKHLHDACGLLDQYKSGETSCDDLTGKTGKLMLKIGKYTNKDGLEIPVNQVDDYVKRDNLESPKKPSEVIGDDEIPF